MLAVAPTSGRPERQSAPPPKKNNQHWVALIAGGPSDVYRELRPRLEKFGISAKHHWDYQRGGQAFSGAIPKDVDIVIVLKDMFGHANEKAVKRSAERAEVRLIRTGSKQMALRAALWRNGITYGDHPPIVEEKRSAPVEDRTFLDMLLDSGELKAPPPPPKPVLEIDDGTVSVEERQDKLIIHMPKPPTAIPDTFVAALKLMRAYMTAMGANSMLLTAKEMTMSFDSPGVAASLAAPLTPPNGERTS